MNKSSIKPTFTPFYLQYLIKARLETTQKALALKYGVSEMAMSKLIQFDLVSRPLMKKFADDIGEDYREVFAWYFKDQKSRRTRRAA